MDISVSTPSLGMLQLSASVQPEKGGSSPPAPATTSKSGFPSKLATYVSHIAFICHNQLPHSWSLMHMWLLCLTILRCCICGWHCLTIGRWGICGCLASLFCVAAYVAGIASLLVVAAYVAGIASLLVVAAYVPTVLHYSAS